jgi:hypothetical protein
MTHNLDNIREVAERDISEKSHLDNMARQGCFVSVHISKPTLRTQITWKELGLPELDENLVSPPSTRPPSKTYNEFQRLESRMRTVLKNHSAGSAGGFRYIKFEKLGSFLDEVEPYKKQYEAAVEPFLAHYDQTVANALQIWEAKANDIYDSLKAPSVDRVTFCRRIAGKLRRAWPAAEKLRDRFHVDVQVMQFTLPAEGVYETDPDLVKKARQQAQSTLNGFFAEAQNELRARAVSTVRRMHDVLVNGDKVTERSINPLKQFVDQFRELSVVSDADFQARLDGLVGLIEARGGAKGLRDSTEAWGEVQNMLEEVATEGEKLVEEATKARLDLSQRAISI